VFDEAGAAAMGLAKGTVCVMLHSGSRGLGHQVCTDALEEVSRAMAAEGRVLVDAQLACARVESPEGQRYLAAMRAVRPARRLPVPGARDTSRVRARAPPYPAAAAPAPSPGGELCVCEPLAHGQGRARHLCPHLRALRPRPRSAPPPPPVGARVRPAAARRHDGETAARGLCGAGMRLVYDVSHNIAKEEEHVVGGARRRVLVHRKGATRAFGPGHAELPEAYRAVGQPVLVGGSMGTCSYVLTGRRRPRPRPPGARARARGRRLRRVCGGVWSRDAGRDGADVRIHLPRRGTLARPTARRPGLLRAAGPPRGRTPGPSR
jgi:hypothetical protein